MTEILQSHLLPSLVTVVSLILYFVTSANVGRARLKYQVRPPKVSGSEDFERVLRVQQNTLEQIIVFLPALWLFCWFVDELAGAIAGGIWIVGRALYAWGYYQAAEKRGPGFGISSLATMVLLLGSLVSICWSLVQSLT